MKRLLFTILSALSLLLCVAVVALWVRSRFHSDHVGWSVGYPIDARHPDAAYPGRRSAVAYAAVASNGRLCVLYSRYYGEAAPSFHGSRWHYGRSDPHGEFDGVTWGKFTPHANVTSSPTRGYFQYQAVVRLWQLAAVTAVLPALQAWRAVKRRRAGGPGKCRRCGYDLRATPGRCPECGEPLPHW